MPNDQTPPVATPPVVPPATTPDPDWKPPTKEEVEAVQIQLKKLQEDNENYKKGLISLKKEKKLGIEDEKGKKDDFLTRTEFEKINERKAIDEMVSNNPELEEHWDEIMARFAQRKGRNSVEDIKSDLQDALDLWKIRTDKSKDPNADTAARLAQQNGISRSSENPKTEKIEPKTIGDKKFVEALASQGIKLT